ncbi:MAG: hypothetical protein CBC57_07115 [Euryarchaeota archaeon TMED97]|nr:MAG: hypothetical protein CBC57_07115 [Euryarchaeota archaeon TMED97]|tara:strand:+ start:209 stop:1051 length:843 start_codon:yes stop_codon:yes gene_type:complete
MTTKINGTNTAANPAITGADTDTGLSFGSDTVNINTGGSTRATVDSAGKLGIGLTNPTGMFAVSDGSVTGEINPNGGICYIGTRSNHPVTFLTNASGRMTIDSSGRVGIGTSTTNNPDVGDGGLQIRPNHSGGAPDVHFTRASSSGTSNVVGFVNGNVGVGSIAYNGSATAFNTSSDYRLKENINAISDGITRLKTLKPSRFNFIHDETNTLCDGFIAHEVSSIVPEAITGEKDAVDSDNNPVYQGIDQSKLVPLLTAALQEAITKIETLETKVAALEAA